MSVLNAEQRKYIDCKMNVFLNMADFKYTNKHALDLMDKICKKRKFSVKPKYVGYRNVSPESDSVCVSFDAIYIPVPAEVKKMLGTIKKERERRSEIVKSIREKMVFGAQTEEMKALLSLLK